MTAEQTKIKKLVLEELESTKFPTCNNRKNIGKSKAFVLGEVNYRGQEALEYKTRGPSRWNERFSKLYKLLQKLISFKSEFKYTTIQVNKNVLSPPHVDINNVGISYIIALGDYSGGELVIEGKPYNIKNKWKEFNGKEQGHWVQPFSGTRYSLVFFTHTFKPPAYEMRNIEVRKDGLYKNGELIKKYI